jgi:hypothetical protein
MGGLQGGHIVIATSPHLPKLLLTLRPLIKDQRQLLNLLTQSLQAPPQGFQELLKTLHIVAQAFVQRGR